MKANEYFKKHGYKKCKADSLNLVFLNPEFSRELGRLVESHELVDSYGGLERAKLRCYPAKHLTMQSYYALRNAIADVESCQ